jgi:hypothetical protein
MMAILGVGSVLGPKGEVVKHCGSALVDFGIVFGAVMANLWAQQSALYYCKVEDLRFECF